MEFVAEDKPMTHWVIRFTPLLNSQKIKILDLPVGQVVEFLNRVDGDLSEIRYVTRQKVYIGWIRSVYLEELIYRHPQDVVTIENPTPYPNDFKQYIITENKNPYYNACGFFCVAFITLLSIDGVLQRCKENHKELYNRTVLKNKGTTAKDLLDISVSCGLPKDKIKLFGGSELLSPRFIKKIAEDNFVVSNCNIDSQGYVSSKGIPHWVSVIECIPDGKNGSVLVYNPAWNSIEKYSWKEYINSVKVISGIKIEKQRVV